MQKQQQKKLALQHAEALRMLEETSTANKTEKEELCGDEKENADQAKSYAFVKAGVCAPFARSCA